jgi:hypothetical protein
MDSGYITISVKLKEQTNDIAGSANINVVEQMQTITLDNSTVNKTIISEGITGIHAAEGDAINPNSIYANILNRFSTIIDKLPVGTISDFNLNKTVDGVTVGKVLELAMAMVDGRIRKNTPNEGDLTFYRRDNTTVLTITRTTETERSRI